LLAVGADDPDGGNADSVVDADFLLRGDRNALLLETGTMIEAGGLGFRRVSRTDPARVGVRRGDGLPSSTAASVQEPR
jgi:hypothetical protein